MDYIYFQTCCDKVKSELEECVLIGDVDKFNECTEQIGGGVVKICYYLGVKLEEDGEYKKAVNVFKIILNTVNDGNYRRLATMRYCIDCLRMGDVYTANTYFKALIEGKRRIVTSKKHEAEFYFLLATWELLRNDSIDEIVDHIYKGFNAGQEAGYLCEGFLNIIQSARERIVKDKAFGKDFKLNMVISWIKKGGNLTPEQLEYLEEMG